MSETIVLLATHFRDTGRVMKFVGHLSEHRRKGGGDIQLCLCDNSGDLPDSISDHDFVSVVRPGTNVGYMGGCALAFESWKGEGGVTPTWVAMVNTDLVFEADFFNEIGRIEDESDLGVLAPDIVTATDGRHQNPDKMRRMSAARIAAYVFVYSNPVTSTLLRWAWQLTNRLKFHRYDSRVLQLPRCAIYAPHGSAVILHRRFFDAGGSLRFPAFMFAEEIHIAEQARGLGLKVVWEPRLKIIHDEHTNLSSVSRERRRLWQLESMKEIRRRYYGNPEDHRGGA